MLIISHISINIITSPVTPIAQGIPQLSIILPFPQLFDFSELLQPVNFSDKFNSHYSIMRPQLTVTALTLYRLYFSCRPGQVSQISIILSRGTLSPRPTPTPTQKHTAAVMSRDKPHKAVSTIQRPLNYSRD